MRDSGMTPKLMTANTPDPEGESPPDRIPAELRKPLAREDEDRRRGEGDEEVHGEAEQRRRRAAGVGRLSEQAAGDELVDGQRRHAEGELVRHDGVQSVQHGHRQPSGQDGPDTSSCAQSCSPWGTSTSGLPLRCLWQHSLLRELTVLGGER